MTYLVTCSECSVRWKMDEIGDVLDYQEKHQAAHGARHLIEFQLLR